MEECGNLVSKKYEQSMSYPEAIIEFIMRGYYYKQVKICYACHKESMWYIKSVMGHRMLSPFGSTRSRSKELLMVCVGTPMIVSIVNRSELCKQIKGRAINA